MTGLNLPRGFAIAKETEINTFGVLNLHPMESNFISSVLIINHFNMGWWSSVKKAVKKAWRAVKATVRAIVRWVIEVVMRVINLVLVWLPIQKKMRVQIFILRTENGVPVLDEKDLPELQKNLDYAIKTFKDRFDIELRHYGNPVIQILPDSAPTAALDVKCDWGAASNEWGEAGEYFARHLAGWNIIPIHLGFPITVFVLRSIVGKSGCSLFETTDYVTLTPEGVKIVSNIAHEFGHCCSLRHRDDDKKNLMYPDPDRDNQVTGWQKFVVRNSRHCTFW